MRASIVNSRNRGLTQRHLDFAALGQIHLLHREVLAGMPNWIPDGLLEASVFRYGIPLEIEALINADVGNEPTYSAAIAFLARRLTTPIRYLEIGVSVGKNFWQLAHTLQPARLVAFDIEAINPALARKLVQIDRREWKTAPTSMRKASSSYTTYRMQTGTNGIAYLCGDVFDERSWKELAGQSFNLVFSDAFHSPDALIHEYEALTRHDLLDLRELVMVWDDLGGKMTPAYEKIVADLQGRYAPGRCAAFRAPLRGWLGENWPHHDVGIFIARPA